MNFTGGCHCGSIEIAFETAQDPASIDVRACQCGFCIKHNSRAVADSEGCATIHVKNPTHLALYDFGLKTATYVLCARCGVYVGAYTNEKPTHAIVIVNALDDRRLFTKPPRAVVYDAEDREARLDRRRTVWTPAEIIGAT
jgi:hypothetical protein